MKILIMSDIHNQWGRFNPASMPNPSEIYLIIVAGDITNFGKPLGETTFVGASHAWDDWWAARYWMDRLSKRYEHTPLLWVPGNHDMNADKGDLPGMMLYERESENNMFSTGNHFVIGTSLCTAFDTPDLAERWAHTTADTGEDMAHWDMIAGITNGHEGKKLIVVSHCPPYKCLDEAAPAGSGRHIGSPGLTNFIRFKQPALVVCGHVHEAAGEAMMGETRVINTACRWQVVEL